MKKAGSIIVLFLFACICKIGVFEWIGNVFSWIITLQTSKPAISVVGDIFVRCASFYISFTTTGKIFNALGWFNSGVMAAVYFAVSTVVSFLLCYGVMLLEQYILYVIIAMVVFVAAMLFVPHSKKLLNRIYYARLSLLNPYHSKNPMYKMPFERFLRKASRVLPKFPEDVLNQWPYEDFRSFLNGYSKGIEYNRFLFSLEKWETKKILKVLDPESFYEKGVGMHIIDGTLKTPLIEYMQRHLTWPRPIIVLDTDNSERGEYKYLSPYHLLEGHLRLVYFRRLYDAGKALIPQHEVWVVRQK